MKTLTEFSTLTLRKAAAARAAAGGGSPASAAPDAPSEPAAEPVADAGEPAAEAAAPAEGEAAAPAEGEAAAPAAKADPAVDAVAAALEVQPDRAARLLEALDVVGNQLDQVRLVRVYQGETGPHGSVSRGEFHYAIDRVASGGGKRRDDRGAGGRGGRDSGRGGGGGGGGPRGGGGGGGMGGMGDRRDKPRGLGSLKLGVKHDAPKDDDRPARGGELPHAGIGWQLTAAPRDAREGKGGPRRGGGPGGPRGPRGPGGGRGPGGSPGGPRVEDRRPGGGAGRGGFGGGAGPSGPRTELRGPRSDAPHSDAPREPRLGPDGQPLPPKPRRDRKPIGPDANGNGPDGKPWDPARREQRMAERAARPSQPMNQPQPADVEASADPIPPKE